MIDAESRSPILRLDENVVAGPFRWDAADLVPEWLCPFYVYALVLRADAEGQEDGFDNVLQSDRNDLVMPEAFSNPRLNVSTHVGGDNGYVCGRASVANDLKVWIAGVHYELREIASAAVAGPFILLLDF